MKEEDFEVVQPKDIALDDQVRVKYSSENLKNTEFAHISNVNGKSHHAR
ncbi:hypothetical protein [Geomicrobium sp. JCM 19055]|nr:hypothetical protein [Geomicrobium sp. JCM 19055]